MSELWGWLDNKPEVSVSRHLYVAIGFHERTTVQRGGNHLTPPVWRGACQRHVTMGHKFVILTGSTRTIFSRGDGHGSAGVGVKLHERPSFSLLRHHLASSFRKEIGWISCWNSV